MERVENYYTATLGEHPRFAELVGDIHADVAIVGGGFTGVASAVELAERGFSVVLLESHRIGWGATGRNGGQVTGSLSGDQAMLRQLRNTEGEHAEQFVWDLRWRGHDIIRHRIARYGINCDLKTGHLYTAWTPRHIPSLKAIVTEAEERGMGDDIQWLSRDAVHDRLNTPLYHGAVHNRRNLHLHSLKLVVGEAQAAASLGAQIFEQSAVESIQSENNRKMLRTARGSVSANTVILAGNAYHRLCQPQLRGLLFPAILGNMTTSPLEPELARSLNRDDDAVYDSRTVLDYYRLTADNRLMFGGGTNYSGRDITNVVDVLRPALESTFPSLKGVPIEHAWTGTAGIVINRIPLIGAIDDQTLFAQGYSGHGIATSHIMAEVLAEALQGQRDRFDTLRGLSHWRLPVGQRAGNAMLALGMQYYRLKERLAG